MPMQGLGSWVAWPGVLASARPSLRYAALDHDRMPRGVRAGVCLAAAFLPTPSRQFGVAP